MFRLAVVIELANLLPERFHRESVSVSDAFHVDHDVSTPNYLLLSAAEALMELEPLVSGGGGKVEAPHERIAALLLRGVELNVPYSLRVACRIRYPSG